MLFSGMFQTILCAAFLFSGMSPVVVWSQPADENWRQRFDQAYRLEPTQALRRISPPFIPQRQDFIRDADAQRDASSRGPREPIVVSRRGDEPPPRPDIFMFHWSVDRMKNFGRITGPEDRPLNWVLSDVLDMQPSMFDMPRWLREIRFSGDWIVRSEATEQAKLDELSRIMRDAGAPSVRFRQKSIERDVMIVRGEYAKDPATGRYRNLTVQLYIGTMEPQQVRGLRQDSANLTEFLQMLGVKLNMPVINEFKAEQRLLLNFRESTSAKFDDLPPGPERDEKGRLLLGAISEQTGLQFVIERRSIPIWVVESEP